MTSRRPRRRFFTVRSLSSIRPVGSAVVVAAAAMTAASPARAQAAGNEPNATTAASADKSAPFHELDNTGAVFLGIESGVSLGVFLGVTFGFDDPTECTWCTPPGFDVSIRNALVWGNPNLAANIADGMAVATGAGALAAVIAPALVDTQAKDIWALEDTLIVVNASLVNLAVTEALKVAIARQRPAFYFNEPHRSSAGSTGNKSFPSGHTSFAFAAVSSAATVSFLRGYDSAPYIAAGGGTLALATGLFRIFADKHWATDVISGAVIGTAIGFSMAFFLHGRDNSPTDGGQAASGTANVQGVSLSVRSLGYGGPGMVSLGGVW